MNKILYSYYLIFFLTFSPVLSMNSNGNIRPDDEDKYYTNYTYKTNIKSVSIFRDGWKLSYPFFNLNSEEKLILRFDDLTENANDYSYLITHCDANWRPSDISESDYIDGFNENRISDYDYSIGTLQKYINYSISIPNDEFRLKLSGNYVIRIYESSEPDNVILTRRFSVVEHKIIIEGNVKFPDDFNQRITSQQYNFTLDKRGYFINDPYRDLIVVINKNDRWFNLPQEINPDFIQGEQLIYNNENKNLVPGGNEYRHFDIKSLKVSSDRVKNIAFHRPFYDVYLYDDVIRNTGEYKFQEDMNGKFFIKNQEGMDEDSRIDADYANVYLSLQREAPFLDGEVFVFGALSDWNFNNNNKMTYNFEKKSYELKMYLKQGYYNYIYVYRNNFSNNLDFEILEGSFSETENDYLIYIYHHDPAERYDKLVGVEIINSVVKGETP